MVAAPDWFVYTFDLLLVAIFILGVLFLKAWVDARKTRGKMLVDIRLPTGFTERHLLKPDPGGDTVMFEDGVYQLTKPPSIDLKPVDTPEDTGDSGDEVNALKVAAMKRYPRLRFAKYPRNPLMGLSMFQTSLRLEEYQKGNPEPIHPFYGRVDADGKFIDNQLTVTSTEWQAQKSTIQATAIAMSVQEREAREKEWTRAMANLPNRMVMYLGLGIAALCSALGVLLIYQIG